MYMDPLPPPEKKERNLENETQIHEEVKLKQNCSCIPFRHWQILFDDVCRFHRC